MPKKARAFTVEEARNRFLQKVREIAKYWSEVENRTTEEMCNGVAFSILNIFDGTSCDLPAHDILLSPHESDKEYHEKRGENWNEAGMCINNDCMLHDMYYI